MKRKYLAILMGIMVASTTIPTIAFAESNSTSTEANSSKENTNEKASDETDENTVLGEVKSVSDTEITIAVGTQKEMGQPEDGQAPEKPDGDSQNGQAPEKPDSDSQDGHAPEKPDGDSQDGQTPEKPDGDSQDGQAPSMLDLTGEEQTISITENTVITRQTMVGGPDSQSDADSSEALTISDIKEGDTVSILLDDDGNAATITIESMGSPNGQSGPDGQGAPNGQGGPGGDQSQGVDSYSAVNEYTEDTSVENTSLESTGTDENAALISSGANVSFDNVSVSRDSKDSAGGNDASFYGVGAAVLATDGTAYVKNGSITTDANGGAGLFAYGNGTIYASDTAIKTEQGTSGGVHAAGGGTLYGWNLDVETNGESSAAIRSDRGGGTMVLDGGTYTSNGVGSPAIYSTADIAANNATLTANGSEAVCIEGLNSVHLYNCDLTGNMSDQDQNDNTWTVILYQSMSGDSEVGNSTFQMDGGSLTSKNGGVFYTTNTESTITLNNVDINYNDDNEFFLQCTGNANQRGWGQTGANGADCTFTAINQDMQGNVIWDSISDLDFYITNSSNLTGSIIDDETYAGEGGSGYCNISISKDSTWTVTGDSTVTSLSNEGSIVDDQGKTVTIQGTDGTVYVKGDSQYTITTNSYSNSADMSSATTLQDWSGYQTEKPSEL